MLRRTARLCGLLLLNPVGALVTYHLERLAGLQVGSFEGGADAVEDGVVQPSWSAATPTLVAPEEDRTRLWATIAQLQHKPEPLADVTVSSAEPAIAVARVQHVGGLKPAAVGSIMNPFVADIVYECQRAGAAAIAVVYRFANAGLAPVELSLTKECGERRREGLCLSSSLLQKCDVVQDGSANWAMTGRSMLHEVPASQDHLKLFWMLRPTNGADDTVSQLIAPPRAVVMPLPNRARKGSLIEERQREFRRLATMESARQKAGWWGLSASDSIMGLQAVGQGGTNRSEPGSEILRVTFAGALRDGGVLPASTTQVMGAPPAIEVGLECTRRGVALVEVEVAPYPAYQPYRPVVMSFLKECGGTLSKNLDAATHTLSSNLVGAASPEVLDLVRDGMPLRKGAMFNVTNVEPEAYVYWRVRDPTLGPPSRSHLSCGGGHVVASLAEPFVTSAAPSSEDAPATLVGGLKMRFACQAAGEALCTLQFGWSLYQGPAVYFRKSCGGIRRDVDVWTGFAVAPIALLQGRAQTAWDVNPQVTLPAEEERATFTVSLDQQMAPGAEALELSPPQIRVFRPDVLEATIVGSLALGGQVSTTVASENGADLEVEMHCKKSGDTRIEVTLPLGSKGSTEGFSPLSFAFTKTCNVVSYWQQWWVVALLSFSALCFLSCTVMTAVVLHFQSKFKTDIKGVVGVGSSREMHHVVDDPDAEYGHPSV